jgi:cysteine desulfurase
VLTALGLPEPTAKASLRLGFGRFTTAKNIDTAATLINAAVQRQLEELA